MSKETVSRGNVLHRSVLSVFFTPTSVGAGSVSSEAFTVYGVNVGDSVRVSYPSAQTAGIVITAAWVSAANTIMVEFSNTTASPATPASGNYFVSVDQLDGPALSSLV